MGVSWKIPIFKADANKAYEEISKLEEKTPENVLKMAKDKKSVLHNDFEWDDKIAGHKYRILQAQKILISLVYEKENEEDTQTRVFQISKEKSVYQETNFFVKHEDEYKALLKKAMRELESFKKRYHSIVELDGVFKEIEKL